MRVYVIARQDLPPGQRAVQACHAVAELMFRHRDDPAVLEWARDHKTMVLLGVGSEAELLDWERRLSSDGVPLATFREPDMGGQATALAAHPLCDRARFRRLRLCG